MGEGMPNSIVSIGDMGPAAKTLVEKISALVGAIFEPYQMKRIARAEIETSIIREQGAIEIAELSKRALHRFLQEETSKQANMEGITSQALPLLDNDSKPERVDDDWITHFFDKCRLISDSEMQSLWARILAGEVNAPGNFSRRTISLVSDLDKSDAELFSTLCGYTWVIESPMLLVYDEDHEIYTKNGVHFSSLTHLENIGLITFAGLTGFRRTELPRSVNTHYFGQNLECVFPGDSGNSMDVGRVMLTRVGHELAPISGSQPVDGFMEYIKDRWRSENYLVREIGEKDAPTD